MVGPLTVSLVLVRLHWLAVTCFVIATLTAVLDPKIQLSHCRVRVTLLRCVNIASKFQGK